MLRVIIVIMLMVISLSGCYAGQVALTMDSDLKKEAEVDPNLWDFGRVKEGAVYKHEFVFKNESGKVLNIKSVSSSCGCTVSEAKKKTLNPQESTAIEVKFNSKGYSGAVTQFIYVNTDNVDNPVIRFIIRSNVEKK